MTNGGREPRGIGARKKERGKGPFTRKKGAMLPTYPKVCGEKNH